MFSKKTIHRGNKLCCRGASDPGCNRWTGKFWATEDEDWEESSTPTTEEFIKVASREGFSIQQLIEAKVELHEEEKVSCSSSLSLDSRCPLTVKIIEVMMREGIQKPMMKPWKGPLPKVRISPPKTLGDVVIKNKIIRL
jgi:hypothetical protein